jgi:hypothetical protein
LNSALLEVRFWPFSARLILVFVWPAAAQHEPAVSDPKATLAGQVSPASIEVKRGH